MAEASGRKLKIKRSTDGGLTYNVIASVQSKTVSKTNEAIDITTDDSDGWRKLLAEPGFRTNDVNVSGVTKDSILMAAISAGTSSVALHDIQVEYPDGDTDTGDYFFSNLQRTGEHTGAVTFEASFQSADEIAYAAAP